MSPAFLPQCLPEEPTLIMTDMQINSFIYQLKEYNLRRKSTHIHAGEDLVNPEDMGRRNLSKGSKRDPGAVRQRGYLLRLHRTTPSILIANYPVCLYAVIHGCSIREN